MALIYLYFVLAILVAIIAALRGRAWWRWLLIALFVTPLIAGLLVMVLPPEPREPVYGDEFAPGSSPQREAAPPDCTIRIIRMSGYHDRFRPYDIFVNGVRIGIVARDCVVDFQVPHGELVIEARTDRGGSRPLLIDAAPGQRTDIYVAKRGGRLREIWAEMFGSANYLRLRQRPTALR